MEHHVTAYEVIERRQSTVLLSLEPGALMDIHIKAADKQFKCRYIGMDKGEFVIMKLLDEELQYSLPPEGLIGKTLLVRYIHKGAVFGFKTVVIGALSLSPGYIFALYPERLKEYSLRRGQRVQCLLPARLTVEGHTFAGAIVDTSKRGCRFQSATAVPMNKLAKDTSATLAFHLPGIEHTCTFKARTKHVYREEGHILAGFAFEAAEGTSMALLEHYMDYPVSMAK